MKLRYAMLSLCWALQLGCGGKIAPTLGSTQPYDATTTDSASDGGSEAEASTDALEFDSDVGSIHGDASDAMDAIGETLPSSDATETEDALQGKVTTCNGVECRGDCTLDPFDAGQPDVMVCHCAFNTIGCPAPLFCCEGSSACESTCYGGL